MSGVILDEQFVNQGIQSATNLIKPPQQINSKQYHNLKQQFNSIQEETRDHTGREDIDNKDASKNYHDNFKRKKASQGSHLANNQSVESVFKDVDAYMVQETFKMKKSKPGDRKILNFCTPIYKKLKREMEHKNRKGYVSLQNRIKESAVMVSHIRNGQSLFDNKDIVTDYHIPVFRETKLKQSLQDLINKSQDEICVKASKENLSLMQCLSPPKMKQSMDQRKSLNQTGESSAMSNYNDASLANLENVKSRQKSMLPVISKRNSAIADKQVGFNLVRISDQSQQQKVNQSQNEEYNNFSYESKLQQIKNIKKSFDFPNNPAYQNANKRNRKKLKFLTDYCRENKIAMSNNEELIMNMDFSKLQHSVWKNSVASIYDNKQKFKTENEELIDVFKNFESMNLSKNDIQGILNRYEDRKKQLQEYKKQQFIKNQKAIIPTTLEDEFSIINQVKKIKYNKDRQQNLNTSIDRLQPNRQSTKLESIIKSYASKRVSVNDSSHKFKLNRIESRGSNSNLANSGRNSISSKTSMSKKNTNMTASKNSTQFGGQSMSQQMLIEHLAKIQQQKKLMEEEKFKVYLEQEKQKKEKLKKLQQKLDNPYMITNMEKKKKKHGSVSSIGNDGQDTEQDEQSEIQEGTDDEDQKKPKRFAISEEFKRKPIVKLIKAAENITKYKKKINHTLLKLLERYDLDRPLMLKEKLDIIWKEKRSEPININNISSSASLLHKQQSIETFKSRNNSTDLSPQNQSKMERGNPETLNLKIELENKKRSRLQLNVSQREIYNKILAYLEKRGKAIQNEQKQFMNILKVVIDGGWIIRETEIEQILAMIDLREDDMTQSEKVRQESNIDLIAFFKQSMKEFGFSQDLVYFIELKKGVDEDIK